MPWPRAIVLLLLALFADCARRVPPRVADEAQVRSVVLTAPPSAAASDHLQLRVTVGPLAPGARVVVSLPSGEIVGAVVPFGVGGRGGVYVLPMERAWLRDGKVTLHLRVVTDGPSGGAPGGARGGAARAPTADEVRKVEIVDAS